MTRRVALFLLLLTAPLGLQAATVSGVLFEDLNLNGLLDAGEPPMVGVTVRIFGRPDTGGTESQQAVTSASGTYLLDVPEGCYVVEVVAPPDTRLGPVHTDCPGGSPEPFPIAERRVSSGANVLDAMEADNLLHYALGDSIAAGVSFCLFDDTEYHDDVHDDRTTCVSPAAILNNSAVGGHTTSHLLRDPGASGDGNTALGAITSGADLVSISIGGNDFLDVDPGPGLEPGNPDDRATLYTCAARAMTAMRANTQEILSSLVAGLPDADIELNTVYDNLGYGCAGTMTEFHNRMVPVGNEILRTLAWGQARRVTIAEVWPDYSHMDVLGQNCCGLEDLICIVDLIHPNGDGRQVHENRFWESFGGVLLGARDPNGAVSQTVDMGFLNLVDTRRAASTDDQTSGGATDPSFVLDGPNDQGAMIPVDGGEFRVNGFDADPRGVEIRRAIVGVRYRGVGTYEDDLYWLEASYDPTFPPHGDTLADWDTRIPLVGGARESWSLDTSGAWTCETISRPNGTRILLDPEAPSWREVTAMLTRNVEEADPPSGSYVWPAVSFADLSTMVVRLRTEVVGAPDSFEIEWDDVWVDIYGSVNTSPVEPLTGRGIGSLTARDPNNCDQPRLDPATDVCVNCATEAPGFWRWTGGAGWAGEGLRFYEVPGVACPPAGDDQVLCIGKPVPDDVVLFLDDAANGCGP